MSRLKKSGFTLIELLVVVAIIALLISILLPSLQAAREQGKRAKCLSNLRSIAQGSAGYAAEDDREHVVPIPQSLIDQTGSRGFSGQEWWWRTMTPFSFGGRTPQVPFTLEGGSQVMNTVGPNWMWNSKHRPLNRYVLTDINTSDETDMEWFHCPSDTGFPDAPVSARDCSTDNLEVPCYDFAGSSYRYNITGFLIGGLSRPSGSFTTGPLAHRLSTLTNTSEIVLYSGPMFYAYSRQTAGEDVTGQQTPGWHRQIRTENVSLVDGSARSVTVTTQSQFNRSILDKMNYTRSGTWGDWRYFLRRGTKWRTDTYPSPGAAVPTIQSPTAIGNYIAPYKGWPFDAVQNNLDMNEAQEFTGSDR